MKYLYTNLLNCTIPDVPEIINNEVYYKEICKTKIVNKKEDKKEEKKPTCSITALKYFFKHIKEEEIENLPNFIKDSYTHNATTNVNSNLEFLNELKLISDMLSHCMYAAPNMNYEAENKLCLFLYVVRQITTKYCLFFRKSDLDYYIKFFKKYKK